jgi:hypothetical protein
MLVGHQPCSYPVGTQLGRVLIAGGEPKRFLQHQVTVERLDVLGADDQPETVRVDLLARTWEGRR